MSFRTILANLNETANNAAIIGTAAVLAREFEASVTGLYVVPAAPAYPEARYEPIPEMFEMHRAYFHRQTASIEAAFKAGFAANSACHRLRVANSASPLIGDSTVELGRSFDLILLSKTDKKPALGVELDFVPRVAVAAGRPVMVIPADVPVASLPRTVIVGWNGSREAARAMFDSLPFLKRAKAVQVVWVDPPVGYPPASYEITHALALHGVKAEVTSVDGRGEDADRVLLKKAADAAADLLIIGAYGRSRLSEFILGGVTRAVLHQMTCPVFLSH